MTSARIKAFWLLILFTACSTVDEKGPSGADAITGQGIDRHLRALASDEFLGRGPFTEGEHITIEYLADEFEKAGMIPGNNGSYYQEVPLVEIQSTVPESIAFSDESIDFKLTYRNDFVAFSQWLDPQVELIGSELVFAGYGIVAPEYGWNDYEGLDVKGKTVLVLVNDPGFSSDDPELFKGETMTYYGRWTYKYEEAARQGAAGVFVIHSPAPAGYPWQVVRNSWNGTGYYLKSDDGNRSRCKIEGWVTQDAAQTILQATGKSYDEVVSEAGQSGFQSFGTGISFSFEISNQWKEDVSRNVVAVLPGSEADDEYIIYSAHWDHFGVGIPNDGDSIYNGASDNATGVAAMLEIAKAFNSVEVKRSIVFLAVTAEEQGLLGSAYYATNPVYPLDKTVANLNIDALPYYGRLKDLTVIGHGQSELDDYAERAAKSQGRYIVPDMDPGKGYFFRSDHFSFAKVGVPALYASGDYDLREGGVEKMTEMKNTYNTEHYHLPTDEYDPDTWDLAGIVEDAKLMYQIGLEIANDGNWPEWKDGSEFKAIREAQKSN